MRKFISYIIIPIFVSIIYSRFIDPNLDNTFLFLGNFFAGISSTYLDYIYGNIGDGIKEIFSYYSYAFLFGITILLCSLTFFSTLLMTIFQFRKTTSDNDKEKIASLKEYLKSTKTSKYEAIVMTVITFAMFLLVISMSIKHHYTYNAIIYIEKSLDILAPKISEKKRLELRAKYRMIGSYESFAEFNSDLISIAKEKNITIPEFKLIVK